MANYNTGPGLQSGGMTVCYFQPDQNFTIFPKGFRMTVGNAQRRINYFNPTDPRSTSLSFGQGDDSGSPGWGETDAFEFPKQPCSQGIRSNIYFPQCWDGVNVDSPDHQTHVVHPEADATTGNSFFHTSCPASHPVRLPVLFLEIIWDTRPFNDPELWPEDGSQPFVFSMGDPSGFGQHADYVFGWEGDSLKRAMEECTAGTGIPWDCPALSLQDMDDMNNCRAPIKVNEPVENIYLNELPGCNPIQTGPISATLVPDCTAASTTIDGSVPTAPPTAVSPPWTVCDSATTKNPVPIIPNCNAYPGPTNAAVKPTAAPQV